MNQYKHNIVSHFLKAAESNPNQVAIIDKGTSITYAELEQEVISTASYFTSKGIRTGDRVMVFVPMSIDLYRTVLALFYIGATAVFLDEWVTKERLLLCCRLADCKGFVGTTKARILSLFAKDLRRIPIKLSLKKRIQNEKPLTLVSPEDSALITFTTGSTGIPKAADRSHAFLDAQFEILKNKIACRAGDIDMTTLPIVLFINLGVGTTSVIADYNSRKPDSLDASLIIDQLRRNKIQRLIASPYFVKRIAEHHIHHTEDLEELTEVYTGGAPVFPKEASIYLEAFPESKISIIYGSTEAEPISSISAQELISNELDLGLAVGDIHPQTELRIIKLENEHAENIKDSELAALTTQENTIGEILVSGKHVLKRYFNNPEAFRKNKIVVGKEIWHRTGDSGFIRNGKLFLTGRCQQLIHKDRNILSPFIIENKVSTISSVSMGTLLNINEQLILALETEKSAEELKRDLSSIDYDRLILIKNMPRDPRHHSKIDYAKLREQLS